MQKIASFTVNHDKIEPGLYISRIDNDIVTYDMRTRKPNNGDYMDNLTMHSLEHMFATYVRNSEISKNVIYFGPMGCQTGFYLLVRDEKPEKVLEIVKSTLMATINHSGEIFGNKREECGNYRNLNLESAKIEAQRYLDALNSRKVTFKYE
jgi:S-ribosylhomocysteine lyase